MVRSINVKRILISGFLICLLSLILFACSSGENPAPVSKATPYPTPTPLTLSKGAVRSIPTAALYYAAAKARNYEKAYTYLSANAVDDSGKKVTKDVFMRMAQEGDNMNGAIVNVELAPYGNDATQIIATIDRNSGIRYHAHLTMKLEGNTWKIVSLDRV
ncbi:hypothetical protein [Dictyobacter aurantiacus]|uniref:DUF4878 domain-containing protein n=1 Tax=Dictyobacter aurantiacus TaxID=1936993 RepID=A0A401ZDF1_9CHLR|nr:hypothetical protein [Dictyobacter aurantiacus]GCE04910.1 hypothetical protein KDAU_22390 [Dictyobacter aurantiacus]